MSSIDIANMHLHKANPSMWDGTGTRPSDFNQRIGTYNVDSNMEVDVSFEQENGVWLHYCELRDKETEELLDVVHGYGVNSPQNIADSIEYLISVR